MPNWIPGVGGLSPSELAPNSDEILDTAETINRLNPIVPVSTAHDDVLEGDPLEVGDDLLGNIPSFTAGVASGDRENAVLTGSAREAYDWMFDYEGTWGGMEDQHDIVGPSFDPDGDWFGYNSEEAQDDPTRPANWGRAVWVAVAAVVLAVLAYLFRPLLEMGANATEA